MDFSISRTFEKAFESKKSMQNRIFLFVFFEKLPFLPLGAILSATSKALQRRYFMGSVLETAMLLCFGFSWPLNVIKAYRAKTAKGTSLPFILLIITGYVAGISAKLISGQINYVLIAYLLNLAIVSLNVLVYFRNASLDRKRLQETEV
jgi:hypothetical protein